MATTDLRRSVSLNCCQRVRTDMGTPELRPQFVPSDYQFADEQEGIELVKLRVSQVLALRARIKELAAVPRSQRTDVIANELSLSVFRLYEARFMIDRLLNKLRRLRQQRSGLMSASPLGLAARTAPKSHQPATHIAGVPT